LYHTFRNLSNWENAALWSEIANILFQKKFATEDLKQKKFGEIEQVVYEI